MLESILDVLACPHCGRALRLRAGVANCTSGHAFDVAREGYLNLLPGNAARGTADSPAMVRARSAFLGGGHFRGLARAVADAATTAVPDGVEGRILDAGAGTGWVLGAVLDAMPNRNGIALDISKHAIRVAARSHERLGAVVADVWEDLPVRDASIALVLNVFAPRNAEEFARVLAPGGALIVVTPRADHLAELVGPLGLVTIDPRKDERLGAQLSELFEQVDALDVSYALRLSHADAAAAAEMGPSGAHLSAEQLAKRVESLANPVPVTISVTVRTYRPRAAASGSA